MRSRALGVAWLQPPRRGAGGWSTLKTTARSIIHTGGWARDEQEMVHSCARANDVLVESTVRTAYGS